MTRRHRSIWATFGLVAIGLLVVACRNTVPTVDASAPAASRSVESTIAPSPTASAPASPIVGEWIATQECQHIVDMLVAAGFDEFIADQVYEFLPGADSPEDVDPEQPCASAVPLHHSHFFTAGGAFGSKDYAGRQVDDGTYEVRGSSLVINGATFDFEIIGDVLTLQPEPVDVSGCSTRDCRFQGAWVLMVSMPGTDWVRGVISP